MRSAHAEINVATLAKQCGVHVASIYRALQKHHSGSNACSAALAIAIHKATNARIPCWELRPDLWAKSQTPPSARCATSATEAA